MGGWVVGWLAGSNENITILTQGKVVVEVGVELGNHFFTNINKFKDVNKYKRC